MTDTKPSAEELQLLAHKIGNSLGRFVDHEPHLSTAREHILFALKFTIDSLSRPASANAGEAETVGLRKRILIHRIKIFFKCEIPTELSRSSNLFKARALLQEAVTALTASPPPPLQGGAWPSEEDIKTFIHVFEKLDRFEGEQRLIRGFGPFGSQEHKECAEPVNRVLAWLKSPPVDVAGMREALEAASTNLKLLYMAAGLGQKTGREALAALNDEITKIDAALYLPREPEAVNVIAPVDYPEFDGTDCAHPAWWRGNDAGVLAAARLIAQALNGETEFNMPSKELTDVCRRVAALSTSQGEP